MKIVWAEEARQQWQETALYIRKEWGRKALTNFKNATESWQDQLESFPRSGKEEPLLQGRSVQYRSIPIGDKNKLIYYIDNDIIHIVDFWDTRREPIAQADKLT